MFKTFLTLILLTLTGLTLSGQVQKETDIRERISLYVPILRPPECVQYLTEFGSTKNIVEAYAQTTGMKYFGTMEIPNLDGVYTSMFLDPDNLVGPNGKTTTEHVVYGFVFTPDGDYFSFSTNIKFKTPKLAKDFQKLLLKNIGVKDTKQKDITETVVCRHTGKQRVVIVKLDGSSITYVVMDFDIVANLSIDINRI